MKCIQINGISIDKEIKFEAVHNGEQYAFVFMPYSKYLQQSYLFINPDIIEKCDMVVVYNSMGNNSIEVYYIKLFLSMLYFSYRIEVEERRKKVYFSEEQGTFLRFSDDVIEQIYRRRESPVVKNWNIRGFWNEDYIEAIHWCPKLGRQEMTCDDFESYLSRAYGNSLCDSYDKRYVFEPYTQRISVDEGVLAKVSVLNSMINEGNTFGNKLKSALRMYYEIFMIYTNMNVSIITLSTILETLLLNDDEDNQRKKVSIRAACIICDEMDSKWKTSIAKTVYFFYKYRNAIVHDGKSYLDFEEYILNNVVENMKHIIFAIVHYYFNNQPHNIDDIKQIVERNKNSDGLANAFDYLPSDAGTTYEFLLPED